MYQIKDWGKLRRFSHIIWDIDGTITDKDKLSEEVTIKIISLASEGVYHSFITGRDGEWIIDKVIHPMTRFFNYARVRGNLLFFGESGSIIVRHEQSGEPVPEVNPIVENHPLVSDAVNGIRRKLRALAFDPVDLDKHKSGVPVPVNHDVIYDANGVAYLVDRSKPAPSLHRHIWSPYKKVCVSFEKVRDEQKKVKPFDQNPFGGIVRGVIQEAGVADQMNVDFSSTAIDVVPVVQGKPFGKSRAAAIALDNIRSNALRKKFSIEEVMARTVCVGDGLADLDFTTPIFADDEERTQQRASIPIIFVGEESQLPVPSDPRYRLRDNIIIEATGLGELQFYYGREEIKLNPARGPRVASAILDFLKSWDYFGRFE